MPFTAPRTRPICRAKLDQATDSDRINDQNAVRGRLWPKKNLGPSSDLSVLAGWKACSSTTCKTNTRGSDYPPNITNLFEAIQLIIQLRETLREKQEEVEVLLEALEYARSIHPENI
ncbi:hypothetical protein [Caballeronia sp. DA-9]|uniref:hypothetical protein n=1 Tax=Caballeronia sp. DA-9 TaxID=3436237 RepID=UPI003F66DDC2